MLKIRYTRVGKKDHPHYRVVVTEHSSPVQGKFVEILGHYNPFTKKAVLDKERITHWLKNGAKPSNTVARLLVKEGFKHKSIVVVELKKKPKAKKGEDKEASKSAPISSEQSPESKPAEESQEVKAEESTPETKSEDASQKA